MQEKEKIKISKRITERKMKTTQKTKDSSSQRERSLYFFLGFRVPEASTKTNWLSVAS
jgi:hypothetical protein